MESEQKETNLRRQWIAAIVATLALFIMGMFIGWPSPCLSAIKKDINMTDDQISWMISLVYIGSILSPLPTGWLMDALGRKLTLMVLSLTAIAAWTITIFMQNPVGIYAARFLGGLWGGSAYTVAPIYLCEIAEARVRGGLNSLFILMTYLGIMFEYGIGPQVSYTLLATLSLAVPVVFVAALAFIPESPYWHLMRGERAKAARALAWLRSKNTEEVDEELSAMERAVRTDMHNKAGMKDLLATAGSRKALCITEVLATLMRMSGVSVIMAYASEAIPQVGDLTPNHCAIIMCVIWIIFGLLSTFLVDIAGRRSLLAVSCAGCTVANAMVSWWFFLHSSDKELPWFPLLSFIIYSVFFPVGLGCVPNMIQGEMFPSTTRSLASGVTSSLIAAVSFATNKVYKPLERWPGVYINYAVYALSCALGVWYSLAVVIETKGKTLEEIQHELTLRTGGEKSVEERRNLNESREQEPMTRTSGAHELIQVNDQRTKLEHNPSRKGKEEMKESERKLKS